MCGDRRHMGNLCISLYKSLKIITMTKAQVDLKKGKKICMIYGLTELEVPDEG